MNCPNCQHSDFVKMDMFIPFNGINIRVVNINGHAPHPQDAQWSKSSLMRYWFGRFKRKSIIVSKSVEMVELTITLFARFRINGDVFDILNSGDMSPNIII